MAPHSGGQPAHVTLSVPAESAFASVLRTTAASLAARLDFTIDDIEDLRIAIGEASALLLEIANPESMLATSFTLLPRELTVRMSVVALDPDGVDTESFAWQVLSTLTETCEQTLTAETATLALSVRSTLTN